MPPAAHQRASTGHAGHPSWSAPQPVADDSAVAQPPTASSPGSSAPQNGPGTRRHATSRARRHSAKSLRAEQRGCMRPPPRTWLAHPQWRRYHAHNWRHFPARSHSPRKRADFPQVFRHERTLANRLSGRKGPSTFPWYRRVGGPIQSPGHSQDGPSNHAPTRSVCTAAAVASLRARFSHSCGINVSLASLGRYARTCERYHGLFSPGSRPTGSSQTLSASPTGLRARWACGLMVLGATKC